MEKLIIVAGSPNSGKTLSVNSTIQKLCTKGAIIKEYLFGSKIDFWKGKCGGAIIANFDNKEIAIISYGDIVSALDEVFNSKKVLACDIIICCSHATRGKRVFEYLHNYIKTEVNLSSTKVIPIYKNLLSGYGQETVENEQTANLLLELI